MKAIVTGAGALLGQGIIRSLLNSSIKNLQVIAVDPSPLSAGLYWVKSRYLVPKAAEPDYIEKIESLLQKNRS